MACRYFEEGRLCRCAAVRGLVVPSLHERERFCLGDEPDRCPTLRLRERRDEALPEEVYYALWLPMAGGGQAELEARVPDAHALP
jgi:hypothetical protein